MAYNGSGTFSLAAGNPVVSGTNITITWANGTLSDIASGMSNALCKDGQSTPTANLKMGSYKFTGLGAGSARTDSLNIGQLQDGALIWLGTGAGTADVITATATPSITAYAAGQTFRFVSSGANTGAVTLNIDTLGAKSVTKNGTTALAAGDIPSGAVCTVAYDGTQFQLLNVDMSIAIAAAAATAAAAAPAGTVIQTISSTAPTGWLKANGSTIGNASSGGTARANADTSALFAVIWNSTSNTDFPIQDSSGGASTRGASAAADFAANKRLPVPDLRGEFVRGLDDSRGVDSGRAMGSAQADAFKSHTHGLPARQAGVGFTDGPNTAPYEAVAGGTTSASGDAETRPRNIALLYCIKY